MVGSSQGREPEPARCVHTAHFEGVTELMRRVRSYGFVLQFLPRFDVDQRSTGIYPRKTKRFTEGDVCERVLGLEKHSLTIGHETEPLLILTHKPLREDGFRCAERTSRVRHPTGVTYRPRWNFR